MSSYREMIIVEGFVNDNISELINNMPNENDSADKHKATGSANCVNVLFYSQPKI